jgi:Domain of unknown function (DUF4082)
MFAWLKARSQTLIAAAMLASAIGVVAYAQGFNVNQLLPGTSLQPSIASVIDPTSGMYFPAAGTTCRTSGGTQIDCATPNGITFGRQGGVQTASTVPIGSVAYASFGNATTNTAGKILWINVSVPANSTVTNINILNGGTVGTDKGLVGLYNNAGTLLANSAVAGATTSGANAFQAYALTAPIAIAGPARYFIAYQANGTTDNIRTVAASTFIDSYTTSATGTFGTLTALTPPTTFTANIGPIAYLN